MNKNEITNTLQGKVKEYLNVQLRKRYLKDITKNIGDIIEIDDKIICFVNQKKLDRSGRDGSSLYKLQLNGFNKNCGQTKEVMEELELDKPIYYIFDHIEFKTGLNFSSHFAHVVFRNCTFHKNIGIFWADDVTFENNTYLDWYSGYYYGNCFLYGNVGSLTFQDENFINHYQYPCSTQFGMNLNVDKLKVCRSFIQTDKQANLNIFSKDTVIQQSKIQAAEIYLETDSISIDNSSIIGKNGVMIENSKYDFSGVVQSPVVIYNGVEFSNYGKDTISIDSNTCELTEARLQLVQQLRSMKDACNQVNREKLNNMSTELQNRSAVKTLERLKIKS